MTQFLHDEDGQSMTEYIVIVALIAIAAIAVIVFFGQNLRALFAASDNSLGGEEHSTLKKAGTLSPGGAAINKVTRKGLENFGSNQHMGGGKGGWE